MTTRDPWKHYTEVMRQHRAANERLFDRLRFIIGDGVCAPALLNETEINTWRALVTAAEEASARHREALEHFLASSGHTRRR